MRYSRRFFLLVLTLFLAGLFSICTGCKGVPIAQETEAVSQAGVIVFESYSSTNPEEAERQSFVDCIRQKFDLPDGIVLQQPSVAHYLSRFYAHTDAFHKARRCDSFVLKYYPDTEVEDRERWYHVALFTFDNHSLVKQIQRLEERSTTTLRVRATDALPGSLTYKAGTEMYRVFFADKQVIFFFYSGWPSDAHEDSGLYTAALDLKECLLAGSKAEE